MNKQNPSAAQGIGPVSDAMEALQKAKEQKEAEKVLKGENIASLNQLLQWSTAHSGDPTCKNSEDRRKAAKKTSEQLNKDREWLDKAFPDAFSEIKELIRILREEALEDEAKVQVLEGIQEYFMDLNYAINIEKLGALEPVMECLASDSPAVRAAAFWVLGSAMRDLQEIKDLIMERERYKALVTGLRDANGLVRAKAVMATSALLRHSSQNLQNKFNEAGGMSSLRSLLCDKNPQVRHRTRFFLQHARETGNADFVSDLLDDQVSIAALLSSIEEVDADNVADVEAAVGAIDVLVETDKMGLLRLAPELPGIIDALSAKSEDHDLRDILQRLATRLA
ncbi:unnamed protein product [Agarophyton chilense]